MTNLLARIKKIKQEKLAEYKKELAQQETQSLADLTTQVEALRSKISRLEKTASEQTRSKQEFALHMHTQFSLESYKQELLQMLWQEISKTFFEDKKQQESWLSEMVRSLPKQPGLIRAGASYTQVDKLVRSGQKTAKQELKLQKDASLDSDLGFIFEGESITIDARLSTYLQTLFDEKKAALYKIAFE